MARMKLILTQEVGGLGAPGDVVDVAAGYGRNYLMPRGFAITWTRGGEKEVELIKRARAAREIRTLEDAQAVAGRLQKLKVRVKRRAGSNGRLFGSVGASDIAAALKDAGGPEIDRRTHRGARPDQVRGRVQRPGAAAPRGDRSVNIEVSGDVIHSPWLCFPQRFPQGFVLHRKAAVSTGAHRVARPQSGIAPPDGCCVPQRAPGEFRVEFG